MIATQYMAIFVRLFSIFLFLHSLRQFGSVLEFVMFGTHGGIDVSMLGPILASIPWLVVAIALWFFPSVIASKIATPIEEKDRHALSPPVLLSVLLSALAVYFLYYALVDSIYWLTYWQVLRAQDAIGLPGTFGPETIANIYATIFELVVSICILLNAKKLAIGIRSIGN